MKRIILTLLAAVVAMACMTSCKSTLPRRFDSFVNSVEKHADSYSPEDWTKANEKFEKLFNEYKENADSYNKEQKKQMNAAIGRYVKAVAKSGVDEVVSAVNSIAGQIMVRNASIKIMIGNSGVHPNVTIQSVNICR